MTFSTTHGEYVPEWTLGWRLRRALGHADTTTNEMAQTLQVGRRTISRWINDETTPKRAFLIQWALVTGVNLEWLETGNAPPARSRARGRLS